MNAIELDQIVNKAAYDLAIKCRLKVGGEAVRYARAVVESLRESGLLDHLEQVGWTAGRVCNHNDVADTSTRFHFVDMDWNPGTPEEWGWEPVFRRRTETMKG